MPVIAESRLLGHGILFKEEQSVMLESINSMVALRGILPGHDMPSLASVFKA